MLDTVRGSIQGFVKIKDKDTGEILVDTHNDVLYGNISTALAQALIGNPNSLLYYVGFGNGGAYVGPTGEINYKSSLGGVGSLIKRPTANLYNTVFVKKLSNNATAVQNPGGFAFIEQSTTSSTNYEDIKIDVTLGYEDFPIDNSTSPTTLISQNAVDNSSFIGTPVSTSTFSPGTLVFNEIALFAGTDNLFADDSTKTTAEVISFVNQGSNFSTNSPEAKSKLMLTHAIFHPVQKAATRQLEIVYTLRIQMGIAQ